MRENKMKNLTSFGKEINLHCLSYQIQIEKRERVPLEESPMLGDGACAETTEFLRLHPPMLRLRRCIGLGSASLGF
jgi:hypothetical protein